MNNLIIRKAIKDDISDIAFHISNTYEELNLWTDWRYDKIMSEIKLGFEDNVPENIKPIFFIASIDNKIVGVASISVSYMAPDVWELSWATVRKDFQRKGIHTKLVNSRLEYIKTINESVTVFVLAKHPELFKKLGFTYITKRDKTYSFLYLKY